MSRIAVSVPFGSKDLAATMDQRFGRAGAFLVAERETGQVVETIDNPSVGVPHGAGPGAAQMLRSAGVGAVISGRFGPKALDALRAFGIEAWIAPPGITAGEAFRLLEDGGLERMQS